MLRVGMEKYEQFKKPGHPLLPAKMYTKYGNIGLYLFGGALTFQDLEYLEEKYTKNEVL